MLRNICFKTYASAKYTVIKTNWPKYTLKMRIDRYFDGLQIIIHIDGHTYVTNHTQYETYASKHMCKIYGYK